MIAIEVQIEGGHAYALDSYDLQFHGMRIASQFAASFIAIFSANLRRPI